MDMRTLATMPNLRLAWRRVTSGLNTSYKAAYRPILEAYELAADRALADLRLRLIANAYQPITPLRTYYPKASGLQRPITYLVVEDLIVYQALANLFSSKVSSRRRRLQGRVLFSNYFASPTSPFAVDQWWRGYGAMRLRYEVLYRAGYKWVVKFDLASFYETVSHEILMRVIAPRGGSHGLTDPARDWLAAWTSPSPSGTYSHGIPQGPVASDILAECILLPIDEEMSRRFRYVRYVDDIRLFGRSEDDLKVAMVSLDRMCRELGLIPHVDKLGTSRLTSLREVRALSPTVDAYQRSFPTREMKVNEFGAELREALDPKRRTILDKTRLRFALFRAPKSARILKFILRNWPRFPEHTDAFAAALEPYSQPNLITRATSAIVRSAYPYDAVKGQAWRLLARLAPRWQLRSLSKRAIDTVKDRTTGASTCIGALIFLCRCHAVGIGPYSVFLK
jgi:hypothetical protein